MRALNTTFYTLTLISTFTFFATAQNRCLDLDGLDDYINLNILSEDMEGATQFTLEFWMKADYTVQSNIRVGLFAINKAINTGDNRFLIVFGGEVVQDGRLVLYDENGGGTNLEFVTNQFVGDNKWHHIAYTRNGQIGTLYVDGVQAGSHVANFQIEATDRISLGQEYDNEAPSDFFQGQFDEFRVWNGVRSISEIIEYKDCELTGLEAGLLAYYSFNQGIAHGDNPNEVFLDDVPNSERQGTLQEFALQGDFSNWVCSDLFGPQSPKPQFDLGADTILCTGQLLVLDATIDNGVYQWSNLSTDPLLVVTEPGLYWVEIENNGCPFTDSISVVFLDEPLTPQLGLDRTLCEGETIRLSLPLQPESTYTWQDGTQGPTYLITQPGTYAVIYQNPCGETRAELDIIAADNCCQWYAPNVFSPNLDGINDQFRVEINCLATNYQFEIFDRWGNQVFVSNDPLTGWNGKVNGKVANLGGTYVWLMKFTIHDKIYQDQGSITIVR